MITSFFVKCKRQLLIFVHLFCNLHKFFIKNPDFVVQKLHLLKIQRNREHM
ncbi:hypothetical protein CLOSTASPAR_05565 [[Clostridium] asparagiforme DSM 15981]|uniref:Uncharacterized protein n=1 Tax=[Clostridium] asparagiforme DSM 15981 TaxID=518636 RepID=C0D8G7_9FIRM|nr:hypothetical protein CLOSTASPAR_05565 [[Clostridium] asparagiforme DSM 15981]